MNEYKGKLEIIYNNKIIQEYIVERNGVVFGYLGHEDRNNKTDILLEDILKEQVKQGYNLVDEDTIVEWVCSKPARHFMDYCMNENEEYFKENVMEDIIEFRKETGL